MASIDAASPLPKYHQLKEIIRAMIEGGELGAGCMIPPEREFCERYSISRMTARQAIMDLVNEGVLYREQGRGTFVAEKKLRQESERLTSFTEDMSARGMAVSSEVLESVAEEAGPYVARMLRVEEGAGIVRVKRVRDADGEPMAIETSHLLHEVAEGIVGVDLSTRSLYDELRRAGVRIERAEQSYEAGLMSGADAGFLGAPAGSPVFLVRRVTFDENDRPFEYVESTYRGDRYRVTTTLNP